MAANLGHLAQAQAGLVGGGEGGAAEAVGAHLPHDAHLLGQIGDGHLGAPDAERLANMAWENPSLLRGGAHLAPGLQPLACDRWSAPQPHCRGSKSGKNRRSDRPNGSSRAYTGIRT